MSGLLTNANYELKKSLFYDLICFAGLKHASESVEILPDSLVSPSSLEVLGSDSSTSPKLSGEFLSPLESPESLRYDYKNLLSC